MRQILIASNSSHKLREFHTVLAGFGYEVIGPADIGLTLEIEETGATFAANAILKAEAFRDAAGCLVLSDDSGLVIDALAGEPGVYSARYGGLGLSDSDRTELVLAKMFDVPEGARTARFVAAIALAAPAMETVVVEERVEGVIARAPVGSHGFGYDPIFYYPPAAKTFAQLPAADKAKVSHRGKAARRAAALLATLPGRYTR